MASPQQQTFGQLTANGLIKLLRTLLCAWAAWSHAALLAAQVDPDGSRVAYLEHAAQVPEQPPTAARTLSSWQEARELLRACAPQLQQAAAALRLADASAQSALGRMLPQISVNAGTRYNPLRAVFSTLDEPPHQEWFGSTTLAAGGGASVTLSLSAAAWAAYQTAEHARAVSRDARASVQHALVETLASALLATISAARLSEQSRAGLAAADARLRLTQRMAALGKATALDVFRFVQDVHATRSAVLDADESLAQARAALGNLLGLDEPVGVDSALTPAELIAALRSDGRCGTVPGLAQRADVAEAGGREQLARESIANSKLEYLPELRLETSYGLDYTSLSAIPSDRDRGVLHDWRLAANLTWFAFDGGQRAARVDSARAQTSIAGAVRRATELAVKSRADRAQRSLDLADRQLDIAREDLAAAYQADSLSRRDFELGHGSALESVEAARWLRYAQLSVAVREVGLALATVQQHLMLHRCD